MYYHFTLICIQIKRNLQEFWREKLAKKWESLCNQRGMLALTYCAMDLVTYVLCGGGDEGGLAAIA